MQRHAAAHAAEDDEEDEEDPEDDGDRIECAVGIAVAQPVAQVAVQPPAVGHGVVRRAYPIGLHRLVHVIHIDLKEGALHRLAVHGDPVGAEGSLVGEGARDAAVGVLVAEAAVLLREAAHHHVGAVALEACAKCANFRPRRRLLELELRERDLPVGQVLGVDAVRRLGAPPVAHRPPEPFLRAACRHVDDMQLRVSGSPEGEGVADDGVDPRAGGEVGAVRDGEVGERVAFPQQRRESLAKVRL
mmetsp:Transcript_31844/g.72924  ORF Transcript_31844/g.72924 Transcript_31844/m.72924 type:complete len:245 (+) Transcript_31844:1459-2193(+)